MSPWKLKLNRVRDLTAMSLDVKITESPAEGTGFSSSRRKKLL
jgi:hypothetical protein